MAEVSDGFRSSLAHRCALGLAHGHPRLGPGLVPDLVTAHPRTRWGEAAVLALPFAFAGGFTSVVAYLRGMTRHRAPELEALARRLARCVSPLVGDRSMRAAPDRKHE